MGEPIASLSHAWKLSSIRLCCFGGSVQIDAGKRNAARCGRAEVPERTTPDRIIFHFEALPVTHNDRNRRRGGGPSLTLRLRAGLWLRSRRRCVGSSRRRVRIRVGITLGSGRRTSQLRNLGAKLLNLLAQKVSRHLRSLLARSRP